MEFFADRYVLGYDAMKHLQTSSVLVMGLRCKLPRISSSVGSRLSLSMTRALPSGLICLPRYLVLASPCLGSTLGTACISAPSSSTLSIVLPA